MTVFRKIASLKQLIVTNTIKNNQKFPTRIQATTTGQCTSCYTSRSLYYQQVHKITILQAPKPEGSLHFFTKSLATGTMSSTY